MVLCTEIHNTWKLSTGTCRFTTLKFCIDIVTCKQLRFGSATPSQGCGRAAGTKREQASQVCIALQWRSLKSKVRRLHQTSAVFKRNCQLKPELCCRLKTLSESRHFHFWEAGTCVHDLYICSHTNLTLFMLRVNTGTL